MNKKQYNLYVFEMLFLIQIDELKHADKKEVKKKNKKIKKFETMVIETLNIHAKPHLAVFPLGESVEVQYAQYPLDASIICSDEQIISKCNNENIFPLVISNITYACPYKKFPKKIEDKIDKIKNKIQKHASKYDLEGEYYARLYESEREYKGWVTGHKQTGEINTIKSFDGGLK